MLNHAYSWLFLVLFPVAPSRVFFFYNHCCSAEYKGSYCEWWLIMEVFCRALEARQYSQGQSPHHVTSHAFMWYADLLRIWKASIWNSNLMEFVLLNRKFSQQPCEEVCRYSQQSCSHAWRKRKMTGRKPFGQVTFGKMRTTILYGLCQK